MRGDGAVYQRPGTKILWCKYYLRGKPFRQSTGTSDEKEAAKFLKARLREVGADILGARPFVTPKASKLTVGELLAALKADYVLREKDSGQTLSHLKRADADFGQHLAATLTPETIDKYVEGRLADGDKPASINRPLQMVRQAYGLAIKRGHLSRAPFVRRLSEAGNARQGFFAEQELRAVVSHLPEDLRDFVRFAASTGMRAGEIKSLTWSDVQGDSLTLRGEHSKNGTARTIPLVGALAEIIKRRQAARRIEENGTVRMARFVFHRNGAAVGEFRKSWKTACKSAGLVGKIFHDLRRSAVRFMVQSGVNPQVAKKISGHKTDSMFQRYSILTTDDLRTALERTEQYREAEASKVVSIAQ